MYMCASISVCKTVCMCVLMLVCERESVYVCVLVSMRDSVYICVYVSLSVRVCIGVRMLVCEREREGESVCSWVPPSVSVLQSLLCVMDNSQVACPLRSRLSLLLSTGRQVLDRWQAAIALKCHNQLVGINLNSCYVLSREEWRGEEKRGRRRRRRRRREKKNHCALIP